MKKPVNPTLVASALIAVRIAHAAWMAAWPTLCAVAEHDEAMSESCHRVTAELDRIERAINAVARTAKEAQS